MCNTPILIKNPNRFGKKYKPTIDIDSQYIRVPCGKCPQCRALRQIRLIQRIYLESLRSDVYMISLSYDNKHLPTFSYNGKSYQYSDKQHTTNMFKRLRDILPPFKYLLFNEYGKVKSRAHWHILLFLPKQDISDFEHLTFTKFLYDIFSVQWAINVGSDKCPILEPLYTYIKKGNKCTFDLHRVTELRGSFDDCYYYVSKYLLKNHKTMSKFVSHLESKIKTLSNMCSNCSDLDEELQIDSEIQQLKDYLLKVKPRVIQSKGFADFTRSEILFKEFQSCVNPNFSDNKQYLQFYRHNDTSPLSPYFRKKLETSDDSFCVDFITSWYKKNPTPLSYNEFKPDYSDEKNKKLSKSFEHIKDYSYIWDDLCD